MKWLSDMAAAKSQVPDIGTLIFGREAKPPEKRSAF
jgi:hypothetical protein